MIKRNLTLINIVVLLLLMLYLYEVIKISKYSIENFQHKRESYRQYGDFYFYYKATLRFIANPLFLYKNENMLKFAEYVYPPLGILLFFPFTVLNETVAYFLFLLVSAFSGGLAAWLVVASRRRPPAEEPIRWQVVAVFILLVMTSGPFFSNFVAVQINLIVLCFCCAAIFLGFRSFNICGGLLLALACWMKIYPGLLLVTMLSVASLRATGIAAIVWAIVLPIVLIWWFPLDLYSFYFLKALPEMAKHAEVQIDTSRLRPD